MRISLFAAALMSSAALVAFSASAQQAGGAAPAAPPQQAAPQQAAPPAAPMPYGMPIDLAQARKAADAAVAKARQAGGFPSAVAIVDPAGELVFFEKMDNANNSVSELAIKKARSATGFRRPTKFFEDALASRPVIGQLGVTAVGGGIPIVLKGHVVGAIGASGAPSSAGDIDVAQAGLDAITK